MSCFLCNLPPLKSTVRQNSSFDIPVGAAYLENSTLNFDLSRNNPTDKIKIALSLVSKTFSQNTNPDNIRIVVELINNVSNSERFFKLS